MQKGDIEIRSIHHDDIKDVEALSNKIYNFKFNEEYYKWQFINPPVPGHFSKGAWLGDHLVAHVGYTPRLCKMNGRVRTILSNHGMMSDPAHRGRGFYYELINGAQDIFRGQDIDLLISHPNKNSHNVQMRHEHYEDLTLLPSMAFNPKAIRRYNQEAFPFSPCNKFTSEFEQLCQVTDGGKKYGYVRDPDYLSWRYVNRPAFNYYCHEYRVGGKVKSAVIFKKYPNENPEKINITEWLCDSTNKEEAIAPLKELLDFAGNEGLKVELWHSMYDKTRYLWLEKLGFYPESPIFHFGLYLLKPLSYYGPILDFRNWYTSMGDHDVF